MPKKNTPSIWKKHLYIPHKRTHKYLRGHSVVVSGEMHGATKLAAHATRRSGSGLTTILCRENQHLFFANEWPGTIIAPYDKDKRFVQHLLDERKNVFIMGCGAGNTPHLEGMITAVLEMGPSKAVVLDADALNLFKNKQEKLFSLTHHSCVLTPHLQEFTRLFPDLSDASESTLALAAAKRAGCTIVLKGAQTQIAAPDGRLVVNDKTTHWLATAGSGDVLAGIIGGLLAQGMPAFEAACCGVWVHSQAALDFGGAGLIAEDIIEHIPPILQKLTK